MSLFEVEHPLAQELAVVMQAAECGLAESAFVPEGTYVQYTSPLDSATGAAIVQIADIETNNLTAIQVPVFSDLSSGLTLLTKEGVGLTEARIKVADLTGIEFPVHVGDQVLPSRFIQFDISPDGVIFFAEPRGEKVTVYGVYESELYMSWAEHARTQASIQKFYEAAIKHLDSVS